MTAATDAGDVLRVRGRPEDLTGILRAPSASRAATVCLPALPGGAGPVDLRARIRHESDAGLATLRMKLAPTTPPGTYESTLRIGDDERPVLIEVEPYPRTRLLSPRGEVSGAPGSEHTLTTTVMNLGNVALDIPRVVPVRLTDADLVDAVLSAVSSKTDSDERLRAFADGLAGADGGTLELTVVQGDGTLEPGDAREVTARVCVPEALTPGRTYAGTWALGQARYTLRLSLPGPEEQPPPPPKEAR